MALTLLPQPYPGTNCYTQRHKYTYTQTGVHTNRDIQRANQRNAEIGTHYYTFSSCTPFLTLLLFLLLYLFLLFLYDTASTNKPWWSYDIGLIHFVGKVKYYMHQQSAPTVLCDARDGEMDLAVALRVTEPARWTSIMGSEYILQCSEYMTYVTEQFKCSDKLRQPGFEKCVILDRITSLRFNRGVNLLRS